MGLALLHITNTLSIRDNLIIMPPCIIIFSGIFILKFFFLILVKRLGVIPVVALPLCRVWSGLLRRDGSVTYAIAYGPFGVVWECGRFEGVAECGIGLFVAEWVRVLGWVGMSCEQKFVRMKLSEIYVSC